MSYAIIAIVDGIRKYRRFGSDTYTEELAYAKLWANYMRAKSVLMDGEKVIDVDEERNTINAKTKPDSDPQTGIPYGDLT